MTTDIVVISENIFMNTLSELEKLGLTNKQAELYVTLLKYPNLRIAEIARFTQTPRSSVYENLNVLLKLGLAEEVIKDGYKTLQPYSVSVMKHVLRERVVQIQEQAKILQRLEKTIALSEESGTQQPTTVRYYKGVAGARQLMWNTLKAKDVVCVYSEWGRSNYVGARFYKSFVSESYRRSFSEHVLINPYTRVLDSIKTNLGSSTSRTTIENIRAINKKDVPIKGETFIYNNVYTQMYLKGREINGFEIESDQFVNTQRSIFIALWKSAQPVSKML